MQSSPIAQVVLSVVTLLAAGTVFAHGDMEHAGNPWQTWNLDPWLLLLVGGTCAWYVTGWRRIRRRSLRQASELRRKAWLFAAGMLCLCAALFSPLDALAATRVSLHMVQHMLLIIAAAPLLVLAAPLPMFIRGLPDPWRRRVVHGARTPFLENAWRVLTLPLVAWLLHGVFLWLWHAPALYQAALENRLVHDLEHASFLFNALLFWWVVLRALVQHAARNGTALVLLFTTFLHGGLLAALMTFSSTAWYPIYAGAATRWGVSPLEDQQLAGLIMWLPAGFTYMSAGLVLLGLWLRQLERRNAVSVRAT